MKNNLKFFFVFISLILSSSISFAYNGNLARSYAQNWWNTDVDNDGQGDGLVDHINYPPYLYYYVINNKRYTNTGDNTINKNYGVDCANFVSQCLIAANIDLGDGPGAGGTIPGAGNLGGFLFNTSEVISLHS